MVIQKRTTLSLRIRMYRWIGTKYVDINGWLFYDEVLLVIGDKSSEEKLNSSQKE